MKSKTKTCEHTSGTFLVRCDICLKVLKGGLKTVAEERLIKVVLSNYGEGGVASMWHDVNRAITAVMKERKKK